MKKGLLIIILFLVTLLSFGAEKKIYLIMPGDVSISGGTSSTSGSTGKVDKNGVYLIYGMVSTGNITSMSANSVATYKDGSNQTVAQLVELVVGKSSSTADLKVAMSYKAATNKYVILADEGTKTSTITEMQKVYSGSSVYSPEGLLTITSSGSRYSYSEFPGYEIKEDVRVFNGIVGNKKISEIKLDEGDQPSNIIEKLEKSGGSSSVEGKIRINPGNHFELEDIYEEKYDSDDFKNFLREANGDYVFFDGPAKELEFKVTGGDHTVEINGVETTFKSGKKYSFSDLDRVVVVNTHGSGNGHWYISLSGDPTSFSPQELEPDSFYIKAGGQYYMFDEGYDAGEVEDEKGRLRRVTLKGTPNAGDDYIAEVDDWKEALDYINEYPDEEISEGTWYTFYDGPIEELRFNYDYSKSHLPEDGLVEIASKPEEGYRYVFSSPKRMVLKGRRKDNKYFDDEGEWWNISFPEEATQEEVFVIAGVGDVLEADVNVTSGDENQRKRDSSIGINILEGKGIEIKNIKE